MSSIRPLAAWPVPAERPTAYATVSRLSVTLPPYWANYARTVAARKGSTLSRVVETGLQALWNAEVIAGLIEDATADEGLAQ